MLEELQRFHTDTKCKKDNKMNRREVLLGTAAVVASPAIPAMAAPDLTYLSQAKYLLLPGLRGFFGPDMEAGIDIDRGKEWLVVWAQKGTCKLGFAINKTRIQDGTYKAEFAPCLTMLKRILESESPV